MKRPVSLRDLDKEVSTLWDRLPIGAVVWLQGELGTGKTTFVTKLAESAGASGARSPSFSLVHSYDSPEGVIFHADCYRLKTPEEARDMDLSTLAARARALLIEWPEKGGAHVPRPTVVVHFEHINDPDARLIEVSFWE